MAYKKLIPILDTIINLRKRRCIDGFKTLEWHCYYFSKPRNYFSRPHANTMKVTEWIETYTNGRFYLASNRVAFEDEVDFLMFKLGYKE